MSRIWAVVLGIALVFPGIELVKLAGNLSGLYPNMTITESCLAIIIMLLALLVFRAGGRPQPTSGSSIIYPPNSRPTPPRRSTRTASGQTRRVATTKAKTTKAAPKREAKPARSSRTEEKETPRRRTATRRPDDQPRTPR